MENKFLNLVLLGKIGAGKSASGNTILGQDAFLSRGRLKSATVTKYIDIKSETVDGFPVTVYDTPGLSDGEKSEEEIQINENLFQKCESCLCIFLLVMKPDRFTEKERKIVEKIEKVLGANRLKKTWILFTGGDGLEKTNTSIKEYSSESEPLKKLFQKYNHRYHVFNNKKTGDTEQVKELLRKIIKTHIRDTVDLRVDSDGVTITLLGKTGVGKSATGNTILGRIAFKAEASFEPVTLESQSESCDLNGRRVTVIDTPGLFDTEVSIVEIRREISHCISMMLPGPHVFIIVLNLAHRFTQEESKSLKILQETFGEKSVMFTMVLFTRGDDLKDKTIEQCLGKPGSAIRKLTEACGNRVHVFNNNQTGDPTQVYELLEKIDNMVEENGGSFYSCKMFRKMERERQERQMKILMHRVREREEEMKTLEEEKESMKRMMEEEQKNQDKERKRKEELKREIREEEKHRREIRDEMRQERETFHREVIEVMIKRTENDDEEKKRREQEFNEKEEQYKTQIKEKEEKLKREREQKLQEKTRREQIEEKREREKQISDEQIQRLQSEMEGIILEKEKIERERQEQLEGLEKRLKEEKDMREDQEKTFEEILKQHEDELKRRRVEWREEYEREKEEMKRMMMIYSETDASLEFKVYSKLMTEYSKWTWSLHRAMMETENKLHNRIANDVIHEVQETDLHRELKKTSEEVEKSVTEFFEKDKDKRILFQWKRSFKTKIKEDQENIRREMRIKLNKILQQRDLKTKIDAQQTQHENTLYEKSKELALYLKDKTIAEEPNEKFYCEFDLSLKMIVRNTYVIKFIDLIKDAKKIIRDVYGHTHVGNWRESSDIFNMSSYYNYIKNNHVQELIVGHAHCFLNALSKEEEDKIRSLVSDVVLQTERMIQSFNISEMGYNISYIQQLTDYIKMRVTEHQRGPVKYVFKDEFFMDLVFSICNRSNKMISDQHRLFREANDPSLYLEKKREEYYSVFQKYCDGSKSADIFGEILCQKLKEPIEQSVYRKTSRDLTDEMRSNCESLNGNRSNLEKHILKTLAEEEDFDKYMNYIHNPRDHFKSFIRDEVSRYISDKFSISVLPKMEENIELLQDKILTAAHESTEHVQLNSGDVHLWLKSFTQRLSDELIFSEKHLSGVTLEDVDLKILKYVMRKELPVIISDIRRRFSTKTFSSKLDYKFRPDELLINHFCQCCWVQCPFCGAICTNTIENHYGNHSAPFHRMTGINGTYLNSTQDLCIDTCQNVVSCDLNCTTPKGNFVWKEMKIAGPKSSTWSITPDLSELNYWKWFVCRFQKNLEKYYNKTFRGKIPDEWRTYSKKEAIKGVLTLGKVVQLPKLPKLHTHMEFSSPRQLHPAFPPEVFPVQQRHIVPRPILSSARSRRLPRSPSKMTESPSSTPHMASKNDGYSTLLFGHLSPT